MRAMQVQAIRPDTSARAAMAWPAVSRQPSRLPGARARAERDRSARPCRERSGSRAYALGVEAEQQACAALEREGWQVLGRRLRTGAGEVDMVAEREGLLAIIEVKARPTLAEAAAALSARQRARLSSAAEILLAENPGWGREGVRFDVLLVDAARTVRRIADAFRQEA
jgi:putative endonuclease